MQKIRGGCGILEVDAVDVVEVVFSQTRVIVSVTGSVSYLNENFVVFSLCSAIC